jgi:archaemetzincin
MKKTDRDKFEQTYGMYKFKLPTKEEKIAAMDLAGENILFKKIISFEYERFYDDILPPDIGDWLMYNKEYGQTHQNFMRSEVIPVFDKDVIYLAPITYGDDDLNQGFINALVIMCQSYFHGMKVKLLPKKLDIRGTGCEIRVINSRIQINVNDVIRLLTSELPPDAYCLLGFTEKDLIKGNKKRTGSFIYGNTNSRVSVFSFTRYDPLYHLNPTKDEREQEKLMKYYFILLKRICKVTVNEVIHLFGLKNCIYFQCIMNGYNTMEEFDNIPLEMCPVCLRKVYTVICQKGVNDFKRVGEMLPLYERFIKMFECLNEYFAGLFDYEIQWYNARLESLNNEL